MVEWSSEHSNNLAPPTGALMHSSPFLFGKEFKATRLASVNGGFGATSVADAFADYHSQDRVAIITPDWEAGFAQNAVAVTALTALFYDAQRSLGRAFYTYPSHYLLVCRDADGIRTSGASKPPSLQAAGRPWSHLDVWPETQWSEVPSDTSSLLRTIFALHAHRVFWPEDLPLSAKGERLPAYIRLILASRLKAVYFYNSAAPNLEITASAGARELLEATPKFFSPGFVPPDRGQYRIVDPKSFLDTVADCFETAPPASD